MGFCLPLVRDMVAGVGARAVGPFQVWVPKVPEVTPWRFFQTGQLQGHQTEPGLPRKLKMLFCPFTDCDVWGPQNAPYKPLYGRPSVSTRDWFQDHLKVSKSLDAQVPYIK